MKLIRVAAFWVAVTLQLPAYADERSPVIFDGIPRIELGESSTGKNKLTLVMLVPFDDTRNAVQFTVEIALSEPYPLPENVRPSAKRRAGLLPGPVEVEKHYLRTFCDSAWVWHHRIEYWSSDHHILGETYFDRARLIAQGRNPGWNTDPESIAGEAQKKACELAGPRSDWLRR